MTRESVRHSRAGSVALGVLATVIVLFFLREASQLLIPIVLGILVSYALEPVVAWLCRHGIPRVAGASLVLVALLGLCGWAIYSLRDDAAAAVEALPDAARRMREFMAVDAGDGAARQMQEAAEVLQGSDGSSGSQPAPQGTSGQMQGGSLIEWVQWGVGSVFALAGHLTVIFFLVFFLLVSGGHFRKRFIEAAGSQPEQRQITAGIIDDINAQIQRFLLVRLITAAVVAVVTWIVLQWMGVEQAAVWGILAGVFNSIPYFGPVIVSGALLVIGLVQSGEITYGLQVAFAALVITSLEGWLLTPLLMGKAERMHVVVVFLGVLLWTWVWGGWGTILAVPMLAVVKSVADHVEALKPIGKIMGS